MYAVYRTNKPGKSFTTISKHIDDESRKAYHFESYEEAHAYATKWALINTNTSEAFIIVRILTLLQANTPKPVVTEDSYQSESESEWDK